MKHFGLSILEMIKKLIIASTHELDKNINNNNNNNRKDIYNVPKYFLFEINAVILNFVFINKP